MPWMDCPKCKVSVQKGAWEVITHCPFCNEQWSTEPNAPELRIIRVSERACIYTALSLVPLLGVGFGVLGAFYGLLLVRLQRFAYGTAAMVLSAIMVMVAQPLALYWAYGWAADSSCRRDLSVLARAIGAYRQENAAYPPDLATLSKSQKDLPVNCPGSGGAYYYFRPGTAVVIRTRLPAAATISATGPASASSPATASAPASAPSPQYVEKVLEPLPEATLAGDSRTFMVTEVSSSHRHVRFCIMSDTSVRELTYSEFNDLLAQPQNVHFAKAYDRAVKEAEGKIKKKPASQPATTSAPASASAPCSQPASGPAAASRATEGR